MSLKIENYNTLEQKMNLTKEARNIYYRSGLLIGLTELNLLFGLERIDVEKLCSITRNEIARLEDHNENPGYREFLTYDYFPLPVKIRPERLWQLSDIVEWNKALIMRRSKQFSYDAIGEVQNALQDYLTKHIAELTSNSEIRDTVNSLTSMLPYLVHEVWLRLENKYEDFVSSWEDSYDWSEYE